METDLRYFIDQGADASVLELPYGGAFTAIAVLPAPGRSIAELAVGLDASSWAEWMARIDGTEPRPAGIRLPR